MLPRPCSATLSIVIILFLASLVLPVRGDGSYKPSSPPSLYIHKKSFKPDRILRVTTVDYPLDCTLRQSVVINGTIPAPQLRFREGDQVWIRVYNDMTDQNFTMHWHGLTQRTSAFSDGTPMVSQWPIPPLHYFDYEFQLQPGDAGTYFYHSHVGFGAVTAGGPLIIEEAKGISPPFKYDEERTLFLSDIFRNNDSYIEQGLLGSPFRWSGETDNVALNGHSRFVNATADQAGPSCSYAVISIKPDRTYRFRFIGAAVLSLVFIAFENHSNLTLIEVDGRYISPTEVSHIEIHTGQRYSVLFHSKSAVDIKKDQTAGKNQYWIQMETRSRPIVTTAYGVLVYEGYGTPNTFSAPLKKPLVLPTETFTEGWKVEGTLKPLPSHPYEDTFPRLSEVTRRVIVNVQQQILENGILWAQSGSPWYENTPPEPYIISLYKDAKDKFPDYEAALANGGFDPKTKTFPAKIGEVLEIVWMNLGNTATGVVETHPMHAHGEHFWDIGTGGGVFDPVAAEAALLARTGNRGPIKRDTTLLYRTPIPQTSKPGEVVSWRAWRIRVRTSGVWMMHCHIAQHMVMGMSTVWVFGTEKDLTSLPAEIVEGYLEFGGNAYGNDTHDPTVLHYWHD